MGHLHGAQQESFGRWASFQEEVGQKPFFLAEEVVALSLQEKGVALCLKEMSNSFHE